MEPILYLAFFSLLLPISTIHSSLYYATFFFYVWFCSFNWLSCQVSCHSFTCLPLSFLNSWKISRLALISLVEVITLSFHVCPNCLCFKTQASQLIRNKTIHFLLCLKEYLTLTFLKLMSWLKDQCIRVQSFLLVLSLVFLSQPCLCSCSAILYLFSLCLNLSGYSFHFSSFDFHTACWTSLDFGMRWSISHVITPLEQVSPFKEHSSLSFMSLHAAVPDTMPDPVWGIVFFLFYKHSKCNEIQDLYSPYSRLCKGRITAA